jgi:hypothetical protein
VQGQARKGLAHLLPDGKLDPAFNPVVHSDDADGASYVSALALAGNVLYVGGSFSSINGGTGVTWPPLTPLPANSGTGIR